MTTHTLSLPVPVPVPEAGAREFFELMKPRVMSLVLFTGLAGLWLAEGAMHPMLALAALLFMGIGAGGAAALNMWWEGASDALMARTQARPIPSGRIAAGEALGFGVVLSVGSVAAMGLFINLPAAALLALTILFYVLVYTIWLKPRTVQNIVIGGAAGALPPMIGDAAVSGTVGLESAFLFLIIFLWTPPHFWALALPRRDEYARAALPMLPVVRGTRATCAQILVYTLLLLPASLLPLVFGGAGIVYGAGAVLLWLGFITRAVALWRAQASAFMPQAAMRVFGFSLFYLFALVFILLAERLAMRLGMLLV